MIKKRAGRRRGRPKKEPAPWGDRPRLTDKQWRALDREFRGREQKWRQGEWPTPAQTVAEYAKVSRQSVDKWRKDPEYRRGRDWLLSDKISHQLEQADQDEEDPSLTEKQREHLVYDFVRRDWTGPVRSVIDQKIYRSIDAYAAHLLEHEALPASDELLDVNKKSE